MKEVTEWNGKPRWMWVWDDDENERKKAYVVCILSTNEMKGCGTSFPVRVFHYGYKHCAEIEEEKTRLTYYELSQLLKCFGVEFCYMGGECYNHLAYTDDAKNKSLPTDYKIRYRQGEWEEPAREIVLKWCEESVNPSGFADIERFFLFIGWDKE